MFPVKPNRNINSLTEEARSSAKRKDPLVSFVIQYFKRPTLVASIIKRLEKVKLSRGVEVLVNIDSMSEHAEWNRVLQNGEFRRYYLVTSGNVHEIRGYNRLAKMAEGEFVVFMQDDDLPPVRTGLRIGLAYHFMRCSSPVLA
jgi:GT2 family glycosyltransferase